jgi:UrcA family protein
MNTQRHTTRLATLALSGLLLLASQAALAQNGDHAHDAQTVSKAIDVRDVDLTTTQGARWLYRRIVSAATAICVGSVQRRGGVRWFTAQANDARRCFDESVNDALARVNAATGLNIEQLAGLDRYDEAVASR